MDELQGIDPESNECAEADKLLPLIFFVICFLKSAENPQLGARFIEECFYIDSFLHEDQLGMIQEYVNVAHLRTSLHYLEKGLRQCERNFINKEGSDQEQDSSSEEEMKQPKQEERFNL